MQPTSTDNHDSFAKQLASWRDKLLDIGNRNPLINTSFAPTRGVLELKRPDPASIWHSLVACREPGSRTLPFPWKRDLCPPSGKLALLGEATSDDLLVNNETERSKDWNPPLSACLKSPRLRNDDLLTELGDRALDRRLRTLESHAKLSLSEQGIHCLFLAFGFIRWFESNESDKELRSPLILIPAALTRQSTESPWQLTTAEDDYIDNLCLRQRFKRDFGLELPAFPDFDQVEDESLRHQFFKKLSAAIRQHERWAIEDRCCLGRFAFPKIAMWQDLGDNATSIAANGVCRLIGGQTVEDADSVFGNPAAVPSSEKLDEAIPPGEVKAILDCDASQLEAIVAARMGSSFVLDGPPGTGKSQTIANIIADALSVGKRVLFVSEKVAALEVVKRRLDDCGLGDFCLECHSSKASRKTILEELKRCLELPTECFPDSGLLLAKLGIQRSRLNEYVRLLHEPQQPVGLSMYELHGEIARLTQNGLIDSSAGKFTDCLAITRDQLSQWKQLLELAPHHATVIHGFSDHPWRGVNLTMQQLSLKPELQNAIESLAGCAETMAKEIDLRANSDLIARDITIRQLKSLMPRIQSSLSAPAIPANWSEAPEDIAIAVLDRMKAKKCILAQRAILEPYVEDVDARFPESLKTLHDTTRVCWRNRLKKSLPQDCRQQQETLELYLQSLRDLDTAIGSAETHTLQLTQLLKITLRQSLSLKALRTLTKIAYLVVAKTPFNREWFCGNPDDLTRSANRAIAQLDTFTSVQASIDGRIALDDLFKLAKELNDIGDLTGSWTLLQSRVPGIGISDLDTCFTQLVLERNRLGELGLGLKRLAAVLHWNESTSITVDDYRRVVSAIPAILPPGAYHGGWVDGSLRSRLRRNCETVINDLTEAQQLRESLESRLSHRAFMHFSRPMIARGKAFATWWGRISGGYGQFRVEVADLYKGPVPDAKSLVSDVLRLSSYHSRHREAEGTFLGLKDCLPSEFRFDSIESWRRTLESLDRFEAFLEKCPFIAYALPADRFSIEIENDDPLLLQLAVQLQSPSAIQADCLAGAIEIIRIDEAIESITDLIPAVRECSLAARAAQAYYRDAPSIPQLAEDLATARSISSHYEVMESCWRSVFGSSPFAPSAFQRETWTKAVDGIETVRRIKSVMTVCDSFIELTCTPSSFDPQPLSSAVATAESSIKVVEGILAERITFITLSPPNKRVDDPAVISLSALRETIADAFGELDAYSKRLRELLSVLKPDATISLERIPDDARAVEELRRADNAMSVYDDFLAKHGVSDAEKFGESECRLAEAILKTHKGLLDCPIAKAIAFNDEARANFGSLASVLQDSLRKCESPLQVFEKLFATGEDQTAELDVQSIPLSELPARLRTLADSVDSLPEWVSFKRWEQQLGEVGLGGVVEELVSELYAPHEAVDAVCGLLYKQLFDELVPKMPALRDFDGVRHEHMRDSYQDLDKWMIRNAANQVREFQLNASSSVRCDLFAPATSELGILKRETEKKRRHMPLRQLFNSVPSILQRLKPCIMMSPLSVSTYLQSRSLGFDLVIFDEASQVFPWDAIGAVYRAPQLIVAGDEMQLPPSSFFSRTDSDSDEEDSGIEDFESILSVCKAVNMPSRRLRWHYRSRREPLIAFSNKYFYDGDLVTFPSARDAEGDSVQFVYVSDGVWADRRNIPEAMKVADLVIDHYKRNPDKSLGVIAFNTTHQQAIEDAIYDRRRKSVQIDRLLSQERRESLFIKNLENVQGDERDMILLSLGYGRNENGRFLMNFGPLSQEGGERRLNVAVTRARESITFVASVKSTDMDLTNAKRRGPWLLKQYLEFAECGIGALGRGTQTGSSGAESPFEESVASALIQRGLHPETQVGCGGFRIDLGLRHPQHPGVYCLGIECDGATYHSSKTARDRDRIRQSILEELGWCICRIWSTDWIRNPEAQVQKIMSAYEKAASQPPVPIRVPKAPAVPIRESEKPGVIVAARENKQPIYERLDDVPTPAIAEAVRRVVARVGAIDWDDLVTSTARELGFARTGRRIRERVEAVIRSQVKQAKLSRAGKRVSMPA